jgi:hypothetical protein
MNKKVNKYTIGITSKPADKYNFDAFEIALAKLMREWFDRDDYHIILGVSY